MTLYHCGNIKTGNDSGGNGSLVKPSVISFSFVGGWLGKCENTFGISFHDVSWD